MSIITIPKNTLLRNNTSKILKNETDDAPINKFHAPGLDEDHKYKKRVNANMRVRFQTMLSFSTVRELDVADLISLLNERLKLEGKNLEDCMKLSKKLDSEFGTYSKRKTTYYPMLVETDDLKCGFIPYTHAFHFSSELTKVE